MRQSLLFIAFFAGAASVSGCSGGATTAPVPATPAAAPVSAAAPDFATLLALGYVQRVCDDPAPGEARCLSIVQTETGRIALGSRGTAGVPAGYGPAQLQAAYKLNVTGGSGRVVAVVDAFDDPNLESDLGVYRSKFGLPPCTTANGCFKKVDQNGGTSFPRVNASWAQETSLDVDMVSANCPNCHILVVETNSATFTDLATGVNTAARLGAFAISNSYGGSESSSELSFAGAYDHAGVAITASAGDSGYGAQVPAAFNTLTAIGGTSLSRASNARGWSETAWSGTGSGCSAFVSKPGWQTDPDCTMRMIADVAYDANPNTGVAVYDSLSFRRQAGWLVFGGTSVGAPAIAAIYALAGTAAGNASTTYANASSLFDVTNGSNGTCPFAYYCTAGPGYDGPTGNGTPDGTGAF